MNEINEEALNNLQKQSVILGILLKGIKGVNHSQAPISSAPKMLSFCKDLAKCKTLDEVKDLIKNTPKPVLRYFAIAVHMVDDATNCCFPEYRLLPHSYKNWWTVLGFVTFEYFNLKRDENYKLKLLEKI